MAVRHSVQDKLAIEKGFDVITLIRLVGKWEMERWVVDGVVIVLAIDEQVTLELIGSIAKGGEVE